MSFANPGGTRRSSPTINGRIRAPQSLRGTTRPALTGDASTARTVLSSSKFKLRRLLTSPLSGIYYTVITT